MERTERWHNVPKGFSMITRLDDKKPLPIRILNGGHISTYYDNICPQGYVSIFPNALLDILSLLYLTLCCIVAHAQLALISEFRTIRFSNYYSSHLTRIFLSCPFKNESTYFECIIHTKIGNTEEGCFMKGWKWMLRNFWSKSLGIQWSIKVLLIDGSFVNLSIRQVYVRETMGTFLVPRSKCAGIKPSVRSPNCWAGSYKIMWKWVASTLLLSKVKNWG